MDTASSDSPLADSRALATASAPLRSRVLSPVPGMR